jgi:hypothetical protein
MHNLHVPTCVTKAWADPHLSENEWLAPSVKKSAKLKFKVIAKLIAAIKHQSKSSPHVMHYEGSESPLSFSLQVPWPTWVAGTNGGERTLPQILYCAVSTWWMSPLLMTSYGVQQIFMRANTCALGWHWDCWDTVSSGLVWIFVVCLCREAKLAFIWSRMRCYDEGTTTKAFQRNRCALWIFSSSYSKTSLQQIRIWAQ